MTDRRPGSDDPHWGPARTYRARPGRSERSGGFDSDVPLESISEHDLIEPDGGYATGEYARRGYDDAGYVQDDYDQDAYGHSDYGPESEYDDQGRDAPRSRTRARAPRPPRTRRRRRPLRTLLIVALLVLVVYPLALAQTAMMNVTRVDALSTASDTPGRNYLLVGSDSRTGTDLEAVDGQRTDTIILLHVPRSGPTVMLSIPRDSEVRIPGRGRNKINASYAIGGPQLLVETVEQATGLRIDGYIETGLGGFADIVNAIGGVEICPKFAMDDKFAGLNVQPGCQEVDGDVALAYARARHSDPRGDLGRVDRQREVMAAIASKAASPLTLINPFTSFPLARAGGKALTVDEDLGMIQLGYFLLGMRESASGQGISLTVPIARTDRTTGAGQVVDWDKDEAEVVFTALRDSSTESLRPIAEEQARAIGG